MKDCDSRSWIGGEGISFRYQVKEKREHRQRKWDSIKRNPHGSVTSYKVFRTSFSICVHGS
jgi:hypothetical protein